MTIPLQRTPPEPRRALLTPREDDATGAPAPLSGVRAAVLAALTGAVVFLLALAAIGLRSDGSSTAAWWPSAGVAVAAVAVTAGRWRPLVLLAVGLGTLGANLAADRPTDTVASLTVAAVLTPWIWLRLVTRGRSERPRLMSVDDLTRFALATLAATTVSGIIAVASLRVAEDGQLLTAWAGFVAAQSASILVLVPFALPSPTPRARPGRVEVGIQVALLTGTVLAVYLPEQPLPLGVLPLPVLLWAAVRFPVRWVSLQLLGTFVLTSVLTTAGLGPYAAVTDRGFTPELVGVLLHVALLVYALVTLPLAMSVHRQTAALENAQESSELAQSVLAGASATLIIGYGRDGTITFFNSGAEQMLGYQADEVVGRRLVELFHLDDEIEARARELGVPPGIAVFTAQVDAGAPSESRDWTMVCRDGRRFIVSLRVTPRRSESGEVVGYLGVGEDVTERHRAEAALRDALGRERDALEHLEQLDRAKTTFVSTVSHELRTPMTSILGYTDMVLDEAGGPVSREQRVMLEAARRNGHRLLRLIEDLLTMSLIEDGTFSIDAELLDLRAAVSAGLDAVRPQLEDRRLELEVELGDGEVVVLGDLAHLERVAINLLANAVKFTPDGGQVTVRVGVEDDEAFLEVSDTGIGIPTDEQGQVFQRFYRSSTAQELEVQGTGLGLSIVETIVTSHGGRVTVASRSGGGTTARVCLPLRQPAEGLR